LFLTLKMLKNKMFYFIAVTIIGLIALIMWSSLTQPRIGELKGNFTEVAFYRNENNTGPINRIYAIIASDTLWEEMKKYGGFMPHTKYGNTKVYFFKENAPQEFYLGDQNFDEQYRSSCVAVYEKNNMGFESFIKWPYE
jgi:hypothetical protein